MNVVAATVNCRKAIHLSAFALARTLRASAHRNDYRFTPPTGATACRSPAAPRRVACRVRSGTIAQQSLGPPTLR